MKIKQCMIYREVLAKRLERKKEQLNQLEGVIDGGGLATAVDKRKYIELKAIVNELENCLDMADSMFKFNKEETEEQYFMAKYSRQLVDRICSLIREDSYTIAEICDLVGIHKDTYHTWIKTKSDFSDSIKKAEDDRMQFFVAEAQKSLLKKIQGYDVEESKTVYVDSGKPIIDETGKEKQKPKIKEKTIVKKHIQPDTAAIIFTLTNGNPERWKNRQDTNFNSNAPVSKFEGMTDEQLEDFINGEKQKRDIVVDGGSSGCAKTPEGEK